MTIFLDLAPVGGGIAVFAAVAFFFSFLAVAFIAFKMLKKSVKLAFRIMIVAVILAIAVAGSVALWGLSGGSSPKPRPTRTR